MVDMKTIFAILIALLAILGLGFLIGFIWAKIKQRRFLKKLDKEIHEPENVDKYIKAKMEQAQAETTREVNNDGRKRELRKLGTRRIGIGNTTKNEQSGEELIGRESEVKRTAEQPSSSSRDGKGSELSDTNADETGKDVWEY